MKLQRYHIQDSFEAKRANFLQNYLKIKHRLRNLSSRKNELYHGTESSTIEFSSSKYIVKKFLEAYDVPFSLEDSDTINSNKIINTNITFYDCNQNKNMVLMDLILTSCSDYNLSADLISVLNDFSWKEESPFKIYLNKLKDFFNVWKEHNRTYNRNFNNISLMDIIINEHFPNDMNRFKQILKFNEELRNLLPNLEIIGKHTEENFKKTIELLAEYPYVSFNPSSTQPNYLQKLWDYLQKLKELIHMDFNCDNEINIFNYLLVPLEKIIGDLVHIRGILPNKIEQITNGMNINLFEILVSGLTNELCNIASINDHKFHFNDGNFQNSKPIINFELNYKPDMIVVAYLKKHNWLIAYLIEKLFDFNTTDDHNTNLLRNVFNLESTQNLKSLYGGNEAKSALNYLVDINLFNTYYEKNDIEKEALLKIFISLPTIQMKKSTYLRNKKNSLLWDLSRKHWKYIKFIDNIELQYDCINENMLNWDEKSLKLALEYIIEHINLNNLSLDKQRYLKDKFNKVLMFEKVNLFLLYLNKTLNYKVYQQLSLLIYMYPVYKLKQNN